LVASVTVLAVVASACGSGADEQQEPAPAFGSLLPTADYGWAHSIGGTGADEGRAIAVDSDGSVYITGKFTGTADFDPLGGDHDPPSILSADSFDVFLAKYDSSGVYQWANSIGGGDDDAGFGIAIDSSDNVYITGRFTETAEFNSEGGDTLSADGDYDVFLAKYDSSGEYKWAYNIDVGDDHVDERSGGIAVAEEVDDEGNRAEYVYLTGRFKGSNVNFDPESSYDDRLKATAVSAGREHTCALLENGEVKCWGWGGHGQLGQDSNDNYGNTDDASTGRTMADLDAIYLGEDTTTGELYEATDISAGEYHTCALLENGEVKCWGYGRYGQLGQGDNWSYGKTVSPSGRTMADLDAIYLGEDTTTGELYEATAITTGRVHTCALLDNGSVRCWGQNGYGQLGQDSTNKYGDTDDASTGRTMADLDAIYLGEDIITGELYEATAISAGE